MKLQTFWITAATTGLLLTALPGVQAPDTGERQYFLSGGVRIWHGLGPFPDPVGSADGLGITYCYPTGVVNSVAGTEFGCIGGGTIPTTEADQIIANGGDPDDEATRYSVMELTIVDTLSGPNVFGTVCNYNPGGGSWCDDANRDEYADAYQRGCGLNLRADATGIHEGNWYAVAFTYNLFVDPATNQVCFGTQGALNVVFSN